MDDRNIAGPTGDDPLGGGVNRRPGGRDWRLPDAGREGRSGSGSDLNDAHRGRGPKADQRASDDIADEIYCRLTEDPSVDAGDVELEVDAGAVTLAGSVESRADKHHIEDLAYAVRGVRYVQNNLRVRDPAVEAGMWRIWPDPRP